MTGQDFERIIRTAMRLEKLQLPGEDLLVTLKDMKSYDPEEPIILETGRMGEPIKSLQKMANGTHRNVTIEEGDLVYITTTPSIAMETIVAKTEDIIYRAGGTVKLISENMRVSGHANPNDFAIDDQFDEADIFCASSRGISGISCSRRFGSCSRDALQKYPILLDAEMCWNIRINV